MLYAERKFDTNLTLNRLFSSSNITVIHLLIADSITVVAAPVLQFKSHTVNECRLSRMKKYLIIHVVAVLLRSV